MEYIRRHAGLIRFVTGRLVQALVSAAFIAALVFVVIRSIPGDPVLILLGMDATDAQYDALRTAMGLDEPMLVQFALWVGRMFTGDWGYSFSQSRSIVEVVGPALENTLLLGGSAILLAIVIALVLGNLSTSRVKVVRRGADVVEAVFLSAPQYSVALILLVAFAVVLPVFPAGGLSSQRGGGGPFDLVMHLVLPAVALALAPGAQMARSLKTSIAELQGNDLLPSLAGRGLAPWRISLHLHHNALPPMVTVLGIQAGSLLGGSLFVETIFSIPGLGNLLVQSIGLRDYALVQAASFVVALLFVLALLAADVLNAILDPRMRVGTR